MPRECFYFDFCFAKAHGTIMFAVATGTTICCCKGRLWGPMLSLSFLDVYACNCGHLPWAPWATWHQ